MFGIGDFFGKMFGTEKALGKVVDSVTNGLDALVYTDEEKQHDAAADRSEARQMLVRWIEASSGQNIARRFIALAITGVWLFQYVVAWLFDTIAIFVNEGLSLKLAEASIATDGRAESMDGAVMMILGFYFAAPYMGSIAKSALEKFSTRREPKLSARKPAPKSEDETFLNG